MSNPYTPATGFTVIRCSGSDAQEFLQNQLSGDVLQVSEPGWGLSGYCSPKGRLLAIFFICRQEDDFLLLTDSSVAQSVIARLQMFVLRSAVTLELCPEKSLAFRDETVDARPEVATSDSVSRLQSSLTIAVMDKSRVEVSQNEHRFRKLCIELGIPVLDARISEAFIPQSVNLDLVGGVSFQKGCYPGQEVVARVRYRGTPKQRMIGASMEADKVPAPGSKVNCRDGSSGREGTVVCAVTEPETNQTLLLASVPTAVLAPSGAEGLSIAGIPLTIRPFGYTLPL
ncbi:MAG: folate-binding protein YgfZ [Proteobacteria bacterium]|jgi:tRNA-modifying protein YgfZ|nr:folate-binding protein YgfZ [Pseudomonadota bacterium]